VPGLGGVISALQHFERIQHVEQHPPVPAEIPTLLTNKAVPIILFLPTGLPHHVDHDLGVELAALRLQTGLDEVQVLEGAAWLEGVQLAGVQLQVEVAPELVLVLLLRTLPPVLLLDRIEQQHHRQQYHAHMLHPVSHNRQQLVHHPAVSALHIEFDGVVQHQQPHLLQILCPRFGGLGVI